MINKASKLRLAVLTAVFIGLLPAVAQVSSPVASPTTASASSPDGERGERVRVRREDRSTRDRGSRDRDDNDRGERRTHTERRRHDPEAFRQLMKAELKEVPALNQRMVRLMDIQGERFELQKQRQEVGRHKDNRDATIKKFHGLLRRDQELSDEARKIVQDIVRDMPEIKNQLDNRRAGLDAQLAKENAATTDTQTSSTVSRELRRKLRYVDYLENKLGELKTHPERLDLLARFLRGLPFDDPGNDRDDNDKADTPRERLNELLRRQRRLRHELQEVEREIDKLRKQGVREPPQESRTVEIKQ